MKARLVPFSVNNCPDCGNSRHLYPAFFQNVIQKTCCCRLTVGPGHSDDSYFSAGKSMNGICRNSQKKMGGVFKRPDCTHIPII